MILTLIGAFLFLFLWIEFRVRLEARWCEVARMEAETRAVRDVTKVYERLALCEAACFGKRVTVAGKTTITHGEIKLETVEDGA